MAVGIAAPPRRGAGRRRRHDVRTGRFERSLSALTAAGAAITAGRDLPVPRRRQLRQQDDVVADRGRADRDPGRDRRGVLRAAPPAPCCRSASAAIVVNGLQGTYLHCAGHRATPRRLHPLQHGVRTAGVRPAAGLPGRRDGPAGRGAAPRRPAAATAISDALPQPQPARRHPAAPGPLPRLRRAGPASTRGTTSPPGWCWPGSRRRTNWPSSPRTRSAIAAPLLDLLLAQDSDPRVPVLALIDTRLAIGETDGWHYDDLPEDGQAWRDTLRASTRDAAARHGGPASPRLRSDEQAALIQAVQDLATDGRAWHDFPAAHVWSLWTRYACTAFYSHPWAWNEIGFPGPAYPRGYLNPGVNARERWEVADRDRGSTSTRSRSPTGSNAARRDAPTGPLLDDGHAAVRSNYRDIRARNDSAWLMPNDGSRTNHRLRADMRRYDDDDEVDLVVVGAGAGGSVLTQRLARAGWRVVCLDAGPFWDPDTDWVSDERGSHTLYWTEPAPDRRRRPGSVGLQQLRARGRRLDGPLRRLHPPVPPVRLPRPAPHDGVGADWPIGLRRPQAATTSSSRPNCRSPGRTGPGVTRTATRTSPHPVGGNGEIFLRGADAAGIDARVGPVAIPNGRFGNRPHCIYRGFCLQGCKVNAKASPLITHIPDALAHGAEIRPDCHVTRVLVDDRTGRGHRRRLPAAPAWSTASAPAPWPSPDTRIETPAAAAALGHPALSRTGWATTTTRSAGT